MTLRPFNRILTTSQVRDTADRLGSPYFSPDTMRFFDCRLSEQIKTTSDSSGYFILSNQDHGGLAYGTQPREYRVVQYEVIRDKRESDGLDFDRITFDSVGDPYPSMKAAKTALRSI